MSVSADWGTARLGRIPNHWFFIISVVNVGERAVTVRELEWAAADETTFALRLFRHSRGNDLPVKIEPDEEVQFIFDPDVAANALVNFEPVKLTVMVSGAKHVWEIPITDAMRDLALEQQQESREVAAELGTSASETDQN